MRWHSQREHEIRSLARGLSLDRGRSTDGEQRSDRIYFEYGGHRYEIEPRVVMVDVVKTIVTTVGMTGLYVLTQSSSRWKSKVAEGARVYRRAPALGYVVLGTSVFLAAAALAGVAADEIVEAVLVVSAALSGLVGVWYLRYRVILDADGLIAAGFRRCVVPYGCITRSKRFGASGDVRIYFRRAPGGPELSVLISSEVGSLDELQALVAARMP
jgi:hypothetical protein